MLGSRLQAARAASSGYPARPAAPSHALPRLGREHEVGGLTLASAYLRYTRVRRDVPRAHGAHGSKLGRAREVVREKQLGIVLADSCRGSARCRGRATYASHSCWQSGWRREVLQISRLGRFVRTGRNLDWACTARYDSHHDPRRPPHRYRVRRCIQFSIHRFCSSAPFLEVPPRNRAPPAAPPGPS